MLGLAFLGCNIGVFTFHIPCISLMLFVRGIIYHSRECGTVPCLGFLIPGFSHSSLCISCPAVSEAHRQGAHHLRSRGPGASSRVLRSKV